MKIDIFCHITPPRYLKAFEKKVPPEIYKQLPVHLLPSLTDLNLRFKAMDEYKDMRQVLTVTNPPIETVVELDDAVELARLVNDEMAELVAKYPDRFVGAVACLPLNDLDVALKEADRAIKELKFNGVQIYNHIMGKTLDSAEFTPLWQKMTQYDLPIWMHPFYPFVGSIAKNIEQFSTYRVFTGRQDFAWATNRGIFGLPFQTIESVTRLVFSQVLNNFPNLKIVLHHCGAAIPFFADRVEVLNDMPQKREGIDRGLKKPILDYYKMFYVDTAVHGNTCALMCGYNFYGAEHILFGTDMPFDSELGAVSVRRTIKSIEGMDIPKADKEKIFEGNARRLLHLK